MATNLFYPRSFYYYTFFFLSPPLEPKSHFLLLLIYIRLLVQLQVYLCVSCSSCADLVHHAQGKEEHRLHRHLCDIASEHTVLRQVGVTYSIRRLLHAATAKCSGPQIGFFHRLNEKWILRAIGIVFIFV